MGEIAEMGVIYRIDCNADCSFYIGSAVNFDRRKYLHLWSLRRGDHHNVRLQRIFDKYGEKSLSFTVIEAYIHHGDLIARETSHIQLLAPVLNHNNRHASRLGAKHTDASKALVSVANKGRKHSMEANDRKRLSMLGNRRSTGKLNRRKVTPEIKATIDRLRECGMGCRRIAKAMSLDKATIQNVFNGKHSYG